MSMRIRISYVVCAKELPPRGWQKVLEPGIRQLGFGFKEENQQGA